MYFLYFATLQLSLKQQNIMCSMFLLITAGDCTLLCEDVRQCWYRNTLQLSLRIPFLKLHHAPFSLCLLTLYIDIMLYNAYNIFKQYSKFKCNRHAFAFSS